jgi:hypothetical protein
MSELTMDKSHCEAFLAELQVGVVTIARDGAAPLAHRRLHPVCTESSRNITDVNNARFDIRKPISFEHGVEPEPFGGSKC